MRRTYLCGYYGMQNSGDDALLYATLHGVKSHFQTSEFQVNTPTRLLLPALGDFKPSITSAQRYRGENRVRQLLTAMRSSQVIFGGGSVLHCQRDMDVKYLMMRLAGKGPHMALGVGVESFSSKAAEKSCRRFLNHCDYVGVRDKHSYDVATAIAPNANIELTFDLAPSLLPLLRNYFSNIEDSMIKDSLCEYHDDFDVNLEASGTVPGKETDTRRGIGVLLCPKESIAASSNTNDLAAEQQRLAEIARAIKEIHDETGQPVYIFDMNGHRDLGDQKVHDQIQRLLPASVPVFRYSYQSNPLRLMSQLSRLKVCLAMRLHGSVFSYLAGTPVISLNYHDKCDGWCDQIGMPLNYRFDTSSLDAPGLIDVAVNGIKQGFSACTLSVEAAYEKSLRNFISPLSLA